MANLAQLISASSSSSSSNEISNFLLSINNNSHANIDFDSLNSFGNFQQQSQQQNQQQIICIQPDGNIVFQTVQSHPQQQQLYSQQNSHLAQEVPQNELTKKRKSAKKTTTTVPVTDTSTSIAESSKTSAKKSKTVACVLANGHDEPQPPRPKKNYKVANLLSSSENKFESFDLQKALQFQPEPQQQQQQQWVLINNSNNLNQLTNMDTFLSSSSVISEIDENKKMSDSSKQPQQQKSAKKSKHVNEESNELMKLYNSIGNDDKTDTSRNDTSKASDDTENKDEFSLLENDNENENESKKRRKACECPNCIK